MAITISALIPAYNAAGFVLEALDSIAAQLRAPDQIVVVDDGSQDQTAQLVRRWSTERNLPVELIRQENAGVSVARNAGIRAASGQWIALLDADDVWRPDHLLHLERAIGHAPELAAAFSDGIYFNAADETTPPFSHEKALAAGAKSGDSDIYILSDKLYESLLPGLYIIPSSMAFRRDAALAAGLFDEQIKTSEDRDFALRLSRRGNFAFVDRVTSRNRVHEGNATHPRNTLRNLFFPLMVLDKMLKQAAILNLSAKEIQATQIQFRRATADFLNAASREGVAVYLKSIRKVAGWAPAGMGGGMRNIMRAVYFSLRKYSTAKNAGGRMSDAAPRLAVLGAWLSGISAVVYFGTSYGIKNHLLWLARLLHKLGY